MKEANYMTSDFAWLTEHERELFERYRGKWVAIWQERVIGVGETATEAAEQAETVAPGENFILHAIDSETDTIYGGL
ncbi:MAG: hypothetical protein FLDDKLPJ_01734 [Phycisphaerae bacterium]|nr:hypothetical protein [Phycisphaerae bacterium]